MSARELVGHGAALELTKVSRYYGSTAAVKDVDLTIGSGEFITLLGPSGSGKSTTLNIIAGFDRATSGEVQVDGQAIDNLPPHRRNMGMVFQHYALFPHMTIAQNIAYPLEERRLQKTEAQRRVEEVLAMVRLEGFRNRFPSQISGGQQQRVALARAIVFSPRVLLMDEPLGALDKKLREQLQSEIRRLHHEIGVTVVFVTHDQEEALALSDRIAVFNKGEIEQVGTPTQLWDNPATPFVADFLGESNLVPGRLEENVLVTRANRFDVEPRDVRSGNAVTLLVRPEKIVVGSATEAHNMTNGIAGRIVDDAFLGSSRRLTVDCSDSGLFSVVERAGAFSTSKIGEEVSLSWTPADGLLLAENDPEVNDVFSRTT